MIVCSMNIFLCCNASSNFAHWNTADTSSPWCQTRIYCSYNIAVESIAPVEWTFCGLMLFRGCRPCNALVISSLREIGGGDEILHKQLSFLLPWCWTQSPRLRSLMSTQLQSSPRVCHRDLGKAGKLMTPGTWALKL